MIELQHPDAPPEVANWVSDLPAFMFTPFWILGAGLSIWIVAKRRLFSSLSFYARSYCSLTTAGAARPPKKEESPRPEPLASSSQPPNRDLLMLRKNSEICFGERNFESRRAFRVIS